IIFPETQTKWTTSTSGIGGYGSPFANNSGCYSISETAPGGTSAPGGGGSCAGDTRYISESTPGFWDKFFPGEKGRVQWGAQYSYFYRTGWSGNGGSAPAPGVITSPSPHAVDNMVWTAFRYYIP